MGEITGIYNGPDQEWVTSIQLNIIIIHAKLIDHHKCIAYNHARTIYNKPILQNTSPYNIDQLYNITLMCDFLISVSGHIHKLLIPDQ